MADPNEQLIAQQIHRHMMNLFQASSSAVNSFANVTEGTDSYAKSLGSLNDLYGNHTKNFKESSQALKDFSKQISLGGNSAFKTIKALGALKDRLDSFKVDGDKIKNFEDKVKTMGETLGGTGNALGQSFKTLKNSLGDLNKTQWEKVLQINEFSKEYNKIAGSIVPGSVEASIRDEMNKHIHFLDGTVAQAVDLQQQLMMANANLSSTAIADIQSAADLARSTGKITDVVRNDITRAINDITRAKLDQSTISADDYNAKMTKAVDDLVKQSSVVQKAILDNASSHAASMKTGLYGAQQEYYNEIRTQANVFDTIAGLNNKTAEQMRASFEQANETAKSVYRADWEKISTELPKAFNESIEMFSSGTLKGKIEQFKDALDVSRFETFTESQVAITNQLQAHISQFGETIDSSKQKISADLYDTMSSFVRLGDELKNTTPEFIKLRGEIEKIQKGEEAKITIEDVKNLISQNQEFIRVASGANTQMINQNFRLGNQMMRQLGPSINGLVDAANSWRSLNNLRTSGGDPAEIAARQAELMQRLNENIQTIPQALKSIWGNTKGYMTKEFDALTNAIETERYQQIVKLELPEGEYQKLFSQYKQVWATTAEGQEGMNAWLADNQELLKSTFGADSSLYTGIGFVLKDIQKLSGLTDEQTKDMIKTIRTTAKSTGLNNVAIEEMTANLLKSDEFQQMELKMSKEARAAKIKEIQATIQHLAALGMSEEGIKEFTEGMKKSYEQLSPQQMLKNVGMTNVMVGFMDNMRKDIMRTTGEQIKGIDESTFNQMIDMMQIAPEALTEKDRETSIQFMTQYVAEQRAINESLVKQIQKARESGDKDVANELSMQLRFFNTKDAEFRKGLSEDWQTQFNAIQKNQLRMGEESKYRISTEQPGRETFDATAKLLQEREQKFDESLSLYQTSGLNLTTEIDKITNAFKDSLFGGILSSAGGLGALGIQAALVARSLGGLAPGGGLGGIVSKVVPLMTNPWVIGAVLTAVAAYTGWNWYKDNKQEQEKEEAGTTSAMEDYVIQLHKITKDMQITAENAMDNALKLGYINKDEHDRFLQKQNALESGKLSKEQEHTAREQMKTMLAGFSDKLKEIKPKETQTTKPIEPKPIEKQPENTGYKPYKPEEKQPVEPKTKPIEKQPENTGYKPYKPVEPNYSKLEDEKTELLKKIAELQQKGPSLELTQLQMQLAGLQTAIEDLKKSNNAKIEEKIKTLQDKLKEAQQNNDATKVVELTNEIKTAKQQIQPVELPNTKDLETKIAELQFKIKEANEKGDIETAKSSSMQLTQLTEQLKAIKQPDIEFDTSKLTDQIASIQQQIKEANANHDNAKIIELTKELKLIQSKVNDQQPIELPGRNEIPTTIQPNQGTKIIPIPSETEIIEKQNNRPTQQLEKIDLQPIADQINSALNEKLAGLTELSAIALKVKEIAGKMDDSADFFENWWDRYDKATPTFIKLPDVTKDKKDNPKES